MDDAIEVYDKLVEIMLRDALEDIKRRMAEGYIKDARDIDPNDMFEMVYDMFETDAMSYLRDQFMEKYWEMI